jgi:hypothetical protein
MRLVGMAARALLSGGGAFLLGCEGSCALSGITFSTLRAGCCYWNRCYMCDNEYLGLRVADRPGVVAGACKNLVKDRMEYSGMRWTLAMAEAMLKLIKEEGQ